jgi:exopolysaccharide biosynthesis polyprenyl glycosylphosphotransferase
VSLPFWAVVIALIKLDDGGPIFYFQERMGRDQKLFKLIKFRTMKVDAEKSTGPVWARPNDDRRTRVGNFLRTLNLDELPQLLNVLKGDMSLVGPRPERPHFVRQFRETIPRYMARHKIKSGITGWAQVNGYRGNTSISERLKYDLYYMENWSLLLDIEILVMTLFAYKNAY